MKKIKITENQYQRIFTEQSMSNQDLTRELRNKVNDLKSQGYRREGGNSFIGDMINQFPIQDIKEYSLTTNELYPDNVFKTHLNSSRPGINIKKFVTYGKGKHYVYFFVVG